MQIVHKFINHSEKDSKMGLEGFKNKTATAKVVEHNVYQVKNVLIFTFMKCRGVS
ncbi:MAG: hypothetical protein K0S39_4458 [Paenibacillus sp.]|jgi:hypothetical protein|nr:hypothetical protein [Paenibacillus sp.]